MTKPEHTRVCRCKHLAFNHVQSMNGLRYQCMEKRCLCVEFDEVTNKENDAMTKPIMPLTVEVLVAAHRSRRQRWHSTGSREWSLAEWTNALCGEAGEAANLSKKILRHDLGIVGNDVADRAELVALLGLELADAIHYAIIAAERAGVDIESALRFTFNEKSIKLKFPERV